MENSNEQITQKRGLKMKNILSRLAFYALLTTMLLLLAACQGGNTPNETNATTTTATLAPTEDNSDTVIMPEYQIQSSGKIERMAQPNTSYSDHSGFDVAVYEVQTGDNLFAIAEQFGLEPETILWGNYDLLQDNPRDLYPGQVLNILPTNGIYYEYEAGNSLTNIARDYKVSVEDIVEYPGNELDPYEIDPEDPAIAGGTMLIIPGGTRELQDWGPPTISRTDPAVAAYYGEGSCGAVYDGPIGDGGFIWPAVATYISGYNWNPPIHSAIDIGGVEGSALYAADDGVVVYSGWSQYGYGNMVVIDHGNGWQTAYAHMLYTSVSCGAAVYQGSTIGALGSTGNSTGPHLHFEMKYNGTNYNPFDYVSP